MSAASFARTLGLITLLAPLSHALDDSDLIQMDNSLKLHGESAPSGFNAAEAANKRKNTWKSLADQWAQNWETRSAPAKAKPTSNWAEVQKVKEERLQREKVKAQEEEEDNMKVEVQEDLPEPLDEGKHYPGEPDRTEGARGQTAASHQADIFDKAIHLLGDASNANAKASPTLGISDEIDGHRSFTRWVIPEDLAECQLGPAAHFEMEDTGKGGCEVVAQDMVDGQCAYKVRGNCKRYFIQGCEFWGVGECCGRRFPTEVPQMLSKPIDGEVELLAGESQKMSEVFQSCGERPVYWNSDPALEAPFKPQPWVGSLSGEGQFHLIQMQTVHNDFYHLKDFNADQMKLIVDVGANVGQFSVAACLRFPDAHIVAFEPHPQNYRFLLQNLERNGCAGKVKAVNRGLSKDGRGLVLNWIQSTGNSAYVKRDGHQITMQTIAPAELWSEEYLGEDAMVSFMKVDCEGCEYEFLPLVPPDKVTAIRCDTHPGLAAGAGASEDVANSVEKACQQGSMFPEFFTTKQAVAESITAAAETETALGDDVQAAADTTAVEMLEKEAPAEVVEVKAEAKAEAKAEVVEDAAPAVAEDPAEVSGWRPGCGWNCDKEQTEAADKEKKEAAAHIGKAQWQELLTTQEAPVLKVAEPVRFQEPELQELLSTKDATQTTQTVVSASEMAEEGLHVYGAHFEEKAAYTTGGAVWPADAASKYPWYEAVGKFKVLPERKPGLIETIRARAAPRAKPCGEPCVAHCVAGQPRELWAPGIHKSIKHRLFDKFSEDPVVFGLFSVSAMTSNNTEKEGEAGYVRQQTGTSTSEQLAPVFEYMGMDRALLLQEPCETGACLLKTAGISCDAVDLGLKGQFDKKTGQMSQFCDVQVRRFQSCMHMVREYENDHGVDFDFVSRVRPDVYLTAAAGHASLLSKKYVYTKAYGSCGYGGMDWQYIAPRFAADIIARFPDEMKCQMLKHKDILPRPCEDCLGCECMLAAFMLSNNVDFSQLPWDGISPAKFCGPGCPGDWEVTDENICHDIDKNDWCERAKQIPQDFYRSPRGQPGEYPDRKPGEHNYPGGVDGTV